MIVMILVDTNILGRLTDSTDPQCGIARSAVQSLHARHERIIIVPQICYEFWAVATRKLGPHPTGENGLGMTPAQASQWLRYFARRFTILMDHEDLLSRWHEMVTTMGIRGGRSHDARLAAAMLTYGIKQLLTFNAIHFRRFPIRVMDPASV